MAVVKEQVAISSKDEEGVDKLVHPLQDTWNFYVFSYTLGRNWEENMQKIAVFNTVERFWGIMNHTYSPSEISSGTDLYVFKEGIQPMWEDPKNCHGGRWLINVPNMDVLDTYWEEILMLIIGNSWETEAEADEICGAVLQPRARGCKISLWTSDVDDEESIMRIGRKLKHCINFPNRLYYQTVHQQKNLTKGKDSCEGKYFV